MGHLVAEEDWGIVDLDTSTGRVFVQEDWLYVWLLYQGVTSHWTLAEKQLFHHRVDIGVWKLWSNKLFLKVNGHAPFPARRVPINFDVRWKTHGTHHWTVLAWKVPQASTPTSPIWSEVDWKVHTVRLSTADILERGAMNKAGKSTPNFRTPPHEFGHTMYLPDEYNLPTPQDPSPNLGDVNSIMNVGRQVRARHLALLTTTLNRLMPSARFSI